MCVTARALHTMRLTEHASIDSLYRTHSAQLMRAARRVLHDRHDAEDALQGAFHDAIVAVRRGQRVSVAYVVTALRHRCLTMRRSARTRGATSVDPDALSSSARALDDIVADSESNDEAWRMLARLRPRTRAVVWLWATGLAHEAIGHALGIATSTVRTHLRRGLGRLREVRETRLGTSGAAAHRVPPAPPP